MAPSSSRLSGFTAGYAHGLAVAAVAISAISFLQLLGLEKAILGIVLAGIAVKIGEKDEGSRKLAFIGLALAVLYFVIAVVFLATSGDEMLNILREIDKAS